MNQKGNWDEIEDFYILGPKNDSIALHKGFLFDLKLSPKARFIFTLMWAIPDGMDIGVSTLMSATGQGNDFVRTGLNELIDQQYVIHHQTKEIDGRWNPSYYEINIGKQREVPEEWSPTRRTGLRRAVERRTVNPRDSIILNTHTKELNSSIVKNENENKDAKIPTPLITSASKEVKRKKKVSEIVAMKLAIEQFTENDDVRDVLKQYFDIRLKRGLIPLQWNTLLENLRKFARDDAQLAIEKIQGAIAGGYLQIVFPDEIGRQKKSNGSGYVDNTEPTTFYATDEERAEHLGVLAQNEDGSPMTF